MNASRTAARVVPLTGEDTSFDLHQTEVGRVANAEAERFDAATKVSPPAAANGEARFFATEFKSQGVGFRRKEMGFDLSPIVSAKEFLQPVLENRHAPRTRPMTFSPIQEWEGCVVAVEGDHITANLVDLRKGEKLSTSSVEIPLAVLEPSDVQRLQPGLFFRWAIGYLRSASGTRITGYNFVFRHLPQWTKSDLAEAKREATELAEYFSDTSNGSGTR